MDIQSTYLQSKLAAPSLNRPVERSDKNLEKIRDVAEEFEANFISQMLRPMFEGIEADAMFGGGHAENMFQDLMIDEYGKSISRSGGIGLADKITSQLLKLQEGASRGA